MEMTGSAMALCVMVGVATGVISALCGVGGGIIMVPAFVGLLGMNQKNAAAASATQFDLPTRLTATFNAGYIPAGVYTIHVLKAGCRCRRLP